jgi:4'-phosphopantetheinyl transferase
LPADETGPVIVDLWLWSLDGDNEIGLEALSDDEEARASLFIAPQLARRYRVAHAKLRATLADYLGAHPSDIAFSVGHHGKPSLDMPLAHVPHFNLSHSGALAALGVCRECEIGVDIEEVAPLKEDIARRFFAPAEADHLDRCHEQHKLEAFYQCWTRKEAFLKATGDGLLRPLDSFEVAFGPDRTPAFQRIDGDDRDAWRLAAFEPHGFAGAVAARTGGRPLQLILRTSG